MDLKKILIIFIFFIFSFDCKSEVRIDITEGNVNPIPIAILDFQNNSLEMNSLGKKISGVIRTNIERTGLFSNLRKETFKNDSISDIAPFRIVNIGNSQAVKLIDFITELEFVLGKKAKKNFLEMYQL